MSFVRYTLKRPGRVVVFFSGGASSFKAMADDPNRGRLYDVVLGITNNPGCRGTGHFRDARIDVEELEPNRFKKRKAFYTHILKLVEDAGADVIALSGWLKKYSIVSEPLLTAYRNRIFNVHPANLAVLEGPDESEIDADRLPENAKEIFYELLINDKYAGTRVDASGLLSPDVALLNKALRLKRKFTGDDAVYDAIMAGEEKTRSVIHAVNEGVDAGTIIVSSGDFEVDPHIRAAARDARKGDKKAGKTVREYADSLQERMKWNGDGPAFLKALELFFKGTINIGEVDEGLEVLVPCALMPISRAEHFVPVPYEGYRL